MKRVNQIFLIEKVYSEKGWNGVYWYARRNNIPFTVQVREFGLDSISTRDSKAEWLKNTSVNSFRAHAASRSVRKASTGWSYNIIRAREITILVP